MQTQLLVFSEVSEFSEFEELITVSQLPCTKSFCDTLNSSWTNGPNG